MASQPRISRVFGAVNIGSFRISAMIAGLSENGEMIVLGSGHRAAQGIKRGYVTDMAAATYAVRDAIERAERLAGTSVASVWIGCSGAGLASQIQPVEIEIGGRRIEDEDIEHLLVAARDSIEPDGRMILHALPACYFLDGADGVNNPRGLHADRLGVDIHVMLADGAPMRNVTEAVQNAHLEVEGVVASPLATGYACLTAEERDLGVALVELGAEVTNVSVYTGGMLVGLAAIPRGSADITDAVANAFGIRRFQAERLKCVNGSAIASPADHREMIPVNGPGDDQSGPFARGADDKNRIPRSELIGVITGELDQLTGQIGKALETLGFSATNGGARGRQVVLTGGGAEMAGLADYTQAALGNPVRIGQPPQLKGLPEAHSVPGFATLAGLVLYAAADPVDIRTVGSRFQSTSRLAGVAMMQRIWGAMKEYF
ncbi:cell division protein FtsA [Altererythrobacter atlanticus]|uniref:Cell division protein FtsA n=1 Tax=Croceibacterium atlanticum TaxID=1267766 RepID=A0A0F7KUD7_9SPHN|nr:cell division protein FtsA [Croceibacterium atlanticum]AKH42380.1 Cell division protein FtsA [Croceibacterium atlanticum]MBB5731157.1 cell division protein FtsA [Croceibacterium atlanticum]